MKRKRTNSSQQSMVSSIKTTMDPTDFYLPDECWERIFKFLDDNDYHRHLKSISLVSKQFLSIINRLRFSLTICDQTHPFLHRLFHRFPNLTSLDFSCYCFFNIYTLLRRISRYPFKLTSLNLSNHPTVPFNALRAFSHKIRTLTSLTCSNIDSLSNNDMVLISHCFPFLEQLDLSTSISFSSKDFDIMNAAVNSMSMALPKLHKVNLSGHFYINDSSLWHLCKNCEFLEEVIMLKCPFLTQDGIAYAIQQRPTLKSLSVRWRSNGRHDDISSYIINSLVSLKGLTCLDLSSSHISDELLSSISVEGLCLRRLVLQNCTGYSYYGLVLLLLNCRWIQHMDLQKAEFLNDDNVFHLSFLLGDLVSLNVNKCGMLTESSLFAIVRNCPSLNEIQMEYTSIGKESEEDSNPFNYVSGSPQLKSLYLSSNPYLRDENIIQFASIFPNLQLLDLSSCDYISEEGICQVLRRCYKIRNLNLADCDGVKSLGLNFEVPKLEVLNLSYTSVDDETLYMISKSCCGLLHLLLEGCDNVTKKGVEHVVENCTQLREINLEFCDRVHANIVEKMLLSRPSLRKKVVPLVIASATETGDTSSVMFS